ncbi:two-component system sensor kinase [Corynebacterium terpenotabidum Y-11]|uniref:Sensor-like histidine kinase SenX3 n=1 Tax=Corynebacterium terpenotabidum Y-11 TaxID=1200352 RepID=S4XIU3_9CORY|nr:two-component system sensor kinase [Corynebacterium terpenotabidum Y-11]
MGTGDTVDAVDTVGTVVVLLVGVLVGVVVTGAVAFAVALWRRRARALARAENERRIAESSANNRLSTVAQVMHFAIDSDPEGVVVVDRRQDVVLGNRAAHDLGLVRDRRLIQEVWRVAELVFGDGDARDLVYRPEQDTTRPSRPLFSVICRVQPLTSADDRFVVVFARDNSENVRIESARRDFVANVSHELKTPVGAISLLVEALVDGQDDPATVSHFSGKLQAETARMTTMISELITLSKLQGAAALPNPSPVSVDAVIDQALARSTATAELHGIELKTDGPSDALLLGDEALLVTAVSNLITNAVNYSPEETSVSVTRAVKGESVVIRVTDHGIGIAEEDQQRVFERFYRVDQARSRSTGGTGLGLALVKHTVINHGGNVSLWSRPGTGSTFSLEFPVHRQDAPCVPDTVPDQDVLTAAEFAGADDAKMNKRGSHGAPHPNTGNGT